MEFIYTLNFSNGLSLTNLARSGSYFVSQSVLPEQLMSTGLDEVTLCDAGGTVLRTFHRHRLYHIHQRDGLYYFMLERPSDVELITEALDTLV